MPTRSGAEVVKAKVLDEVAGDRGLGRRSAGAASLSGGGCCAALATAAYAIIAPKLSEVGGIASSCCRISASAAASASALTLGLLCAAGGFAWA